MEKEKVILDGKDIMRFRQVSDGYTPMTQIIKSFNERNKMLIFSMWDDFSFEGYNRNLSSMRTSTKLELEIDIQHPLYSSFNKLLSNDEKIIIDDDHTLGYNIKTMEISRKTECIVLTFTNNKENQEDIQKFYIFIKNIMEDNRSKNNAIKGRLIEFFNEVREKFLEKAQISKKDKEIEVK